MHRVALLVVLASVLHACASSGTSTPRGSPDLITRAEIEALGPEVANAYQIVERLRPSMLQARGVFSPSGGSMTAVVYLNRVRLGEPRSLEGISADAVLSIRYVGSSDATTRYGTGHAGGVIEVQTSRQ